MDARRQEWNNTILRLRFLQWHHLATQSDDGPVPFSDDRRRANSARRRAGTRGGGSLESYLEYRKANPAFDQLTWIRRMLRKFSMTASLGSMRAYVEQRSRNPYVPTTLRRVTPMTAACSLQTFLAANCAVKCVRRPGTLKLVFYPVQDPQMAKCISSNGFRGGISTRGGALTTR